MKKVLFMVDTEVARRSIEPVLDQFMNHGYGCRVLPSPVTFDSLEPYQELFIDAIGACGGLWDFIITSSPLNRMLFRGKHVSIPHGSMFGNGAWPLTMVTGSDFYIGISPGELGYIKDHVSDFDEAKFFPAGNPANDYLAKFSRPGQSSYLESKMDSRRSLGLDARKTILISSHWASTGNLRAFGTGLLEAVYWNFPDHQIICTCHPNLLTSPKSEFAIEGSIETPDFDARWLIEALRGKEDSRVRIVTDKRASDLMFSADIFVGDHSSSLVEAAFFDLPLVLRNTRLYFDKGISEIVRGDAIVFESVDDLVGAIRRADKLKESSQGLNKEIKRKFLYNVGDSAKTIFEKLHSLG